MNHSSGFSNILLASAAFFAKTWKLICFESVAELMHWETTTPPPPHPPTPDLLPCETSPLFCCCYCGELCVILMRLLDNITTSDEHDLFSGYWSALEVNSHHHHRHHHIQVKQKYEGKVSIKMVLKGGWTVIRVVRLSSWGWIVMRVVSHQGGLSLGWPLIRVDSHQGGLSSGWSLIRVLCHQGGLSSGWSLIRVVSHQGGLSSGCSLIRVVCHQGDLSSGWSLIRVICHQSDLSSGWSLISVVSHQGDLSSGWSHQGAPSSGWMLIIRVVSHEGFHITSSVQCFVTLSWDWCLQCTAPICAHAACSSRRWPRNLTPLLYLLPLPPCLLFLLLLPPPQGNRRHHPVQGTLGTEWRYSPGSFPLSLLFLAVVSFQHWIALLTWQLPFVAFGCLCVFSSVFLKYKKIVCFSFFSPDFFKE